MYDLTRFTMAEMTRCGAALRDIGEGAQSMEEVADRIVSHLHSNMCDEVSSEPGTALGRLFKTHPYDELSSDLQEFALEVLGRQPDDPSMKCLTLLATRGTQEGWNSRHTSKGHKAIPLISGEMANAFPMISNLVQQFGLEASDLLNPEPHMLVDMEQEAYNVFFEPSALGSDFIVAQEEFVIPQKIESCLGFGGMLPSGNLFAVIIFSTVPVSPHVASMFRTIALSVKLALLPFEGRVFSNSVISR